MTSCRRLSTFVVVDSTVSDYQSLVNSISPEANVLVLDRERDGIEQITQALTGVKTVKSLHILSHGDSGALRLGSTTLNWQNLDRYTSHLRSWTNALAGAEVLLYGCKVAAGTMGQWFVRQLKSLIGAEVAASTNLTGSTALGGDWTLEFSTGPIQSPLVFSSAAMAAYPHVLPILVTDTFRGDDVVDKNWRTGIGPAVPGSPAPQQPFLTARSTVVAPDGGIQGSPAGPLDPVGEGALRLTNNIADQAAFTLFNRPISSTDGLTITFELYAYGGTTNPQRADGVSFFLLDGSVSPDNAGAFGGSLGYAQKTGIAPGITGGYLGIGFDEFGNFSSPSDFAGGPAVRSGGPGQVADSIAIRAGGATDYRYIAGTDSLPFGIDNPAATTRDAAKRTVKIDLTPEGLLTVQIDGNNDGDFLDPGESDARLTNINVASINGTAPPSTLKFGFASGTGDFNNIHEVRNLVVSTLNNDPTAVDFSEIVTPGNAIALPGFAATDPDVAEGDSIETFTISTLPDPSQGTLFVGDPAAGGVPVTANTPLTPAQIQTIFFQSATGFTGTTFTYTATDTRGASDLTPATVTVRVADPNNRPPDTAPSTLEIARSSAAIVPGLSGTDPDGNATVESFRILTLPPANQGVLYLGDPAQGGTPIAERQTLTRAQIQQVYFQSSANFTGSNFTYAAIDNQGARDPSPATVRLVQGAVDPVFCGPGVTRRGNSNSNTLRGTPNVDTLRGVNGNDRLVGRDCNDMLDGGRGNDRLAGGAARDVLMGAQGGDRAFGNAGDDVINLGLGFDRGFGGKGNDSINGRRGNDTIAGKGGNDQLLGGRGKDKGNGGPNADFLNGQQGDDDLKGAKGNDELNGGLGRDRLRGDQKADKTVGRRGNDALFGGGGVDRMFGNKGNDRLVGNTQADRLFAGLGDDVIDGGGGNDQIRTGGGSDRIVYRSALRGVDTILDFDVARDVIDLRRAVNKAEYGREDRFNAYVRLGAGTNGAVLRVDSNGDAAGGFTRLAVLQGVEVSTLTPTNFLV